QTCTHILLYTMIASTPSHMAMDRSQVQQKPSAEAGHSITLHCNFSSSYSNPYIFWYQQLPAQPPKLLLQVGKWKPQAESGRFSSSLSVENSLVLLWVRNAELQDSIVYLCWGMWDTK
uniref:Ig-like domain-containing protein n=1 Tax=Dromaius novaehollandiae TaxID=8790 RepID=A0A8C4JXV8_DRONO